MEGRANTEKKKTIQIRKQIKTQQCPHGWRNGWGKKRNDRMNKDRLKGCVMERRKACIIAAGLCVNVVSTLEAICCDNDKILTLEGRKCSVGRTND